MTNDLARTILDLLRDAQKNFERHARRQCDEFGLSYSQMSVILLLRQNGPMNISDLTKAMGLSKSTVSAVIDRLEEQAYVLRDRSTTDRRVVSVSLTHGFEQLSYNLESAFEQFICELFQDASEEDLRQIIRGITKLNQIISA